MPQIPPTIMTSNPLAAMLGLQRRQTPQVNLRADQQDRLVEMLRNREFNPEGAGASAADVSNLSMDVAEGNYNAPEEVARREQEKQDVLAKLLLPIREHNAGALEVANVNAKAHVAAAEALANQKNELAGSGQHFKAQQAQQSAQTKMQQSAQNAQNADLYRRAAGIEKKGGYDFWNSLMGRPTNAQQEAAKLRAQAVTPTAAGPEAAPAQDAASSMAAQLFAADPAGMAKIGPYLSQHGYAPDDIGAVMAAYQQLGGR